ncbi:CoA ester lyase [uncultured Roseobacter sp.]|uniref:HpcH/HpaI aldolase/citrate lyase family protein n=1 Tax=uncultured Roseobacter sp. TaxID=114847 RepID=UPI00260F0D30|nr:CoA ester lyase [uncultured Roseobacter sp.]
MTAQPRPLRSVLYIPGSKPRALVKAKSLATDAIIFDLEDAVAPDEKAAARELLVEALDEGGYGARVKIVRINALSTPWGLADAQAARDVGADAVLLPKVDGPADLDALAELTGDVPLWAMMETPLGMLNASQIAAHPCCHGMVMGTNDLAKDMNARHRADRLPLMTGLGLCVLAAKAHGVAIIDGVYNAFKDEEGLAAECAQGRDMGFDGKTLIHPAQLDIANTAYSPSPSDLELAARQIEAYEAAVAQGQAVAVVDGRIVENLHVATARETLAKMDAIQALAAE